ncbi:hypothetical protein B0H11DRAFT_1921440 [Mycena galericulata]|nr:hypothetical protein B0H11DRAFT_1921440 [Mycena galericulata]
MSTCTSKHTAADHDFLDGLPGRQLIEFRNYGFSHPERPVCRPRRVFGASFSSICLYSHQNRNFGTSGTLGASYIGETRTSVNASASKPEFNQGGREVLELQPDSEVEDSDIEEVSGPLCSVWNFEGKFFLFKYSLRGRHSLGDFP